MRRSSSVALATLTLVSVLVLPVVTNVAASALPEAWKPYMWMAWPVSAVFTALVVSTEIRRRRVEAQNLSSQVEPPFPSVRHPAIAGCRLLGGSIPTVGSITAVDLGVKPSIAGKDASQGLVPYVNRDEDDRLRQGIVRGGLVLVYGASAAGKSRAAFEALHELSEDTLVLIPERPEALRDLARASDFVRPLVVWLDDLERFLVPSGLDRATLDHLCDARESYVLLLATIRSDELAKFEGASSPAVMHENARSLVRAGADVLSQTRCRIEIGATLSESELLRARALSNDGRIAEALRHSDSGFGEYLAAGPQMISRWMAAGSYDHNPGSAIISAAVDFRRAGYGKPLRAEMLSRVYKEYLPMRARHHPDNQDFQRHLSWARSRVAGASSCLSVVDEDSFVAPDYLIHQTIVGSSPLAAKPIKDAVWSVALEVSGPETYFTLGAAAHYHGQLSVAERAFRKGVDEEDPYCLNGLGVVFIELGNLDLATRYLHEAEARGLLEAKFNLANVEWSAGDEESAHERFLELAKNHEFPPAMMNLGLMAARHDEVDQEEHWYRLAAELGHPPAMHNLAILLDRQGDFQEAERWYRKAYSSGLAGSMAALGVCFEDRGDAQGAEAAYSASMHAGFRPAILALGLLLQRQGAIARAEAVYRAGAVAGYVPAMVNLALLLSGTGEVDQAEIWYRRAAEAGSPEAMNSLGILLEDNGNHGEAEKWFLQAGRAGHVEALLNRSELERRLGRINNDASWWSPLFEPRDETE